MKMIVNLDVMMAKRKVTLKDLANEIGITENKLVKIHSHYL
jgi:DNA-binding Xre family transcriptional regulator